MDSLLRYGYLWQRCNACGDGYAVTLFDTLMEQNMAKEWQSPRHCEECRQAASPLASVIPHDVLERLNSAWMEVVAAAESAGFELEAGTPPPSGGPA